MRVLLAGGQGFVGLNIAEQLLTHGSSVALFGPNSAPPSFKSALKDVPGELIIMEGDVSQAAMSDFLKWGEAYPLSAR